MESSIKSQRVPELTRALGCSLLACVWLLPVAAFAEPANAGAATPAKATPEVHEVTLEARVVGNKEQPQVLYILPWAAAVPQTLAAGEIRRHYHGVYAHHELPKTSKE